LNDCDESSFSSIERIARPRNRRKRRESGGRKTKPDVSHRGHSQRLTARDELTRGREREGTPSTAILSLSSSGPSSMYDENRAPIAIPKGRREQETIPPMIPDREVVANGIQKRERKDKTRSEPKPEEHEVFPFKPDFYMLEALKKEIGEIPHKLLDQGYDFVDIIDGDESGVSNLSKEDESELCRNADKMSKRLSKARRRSVKNVEKLRALENRRKISTQQVAQNDREEDETTTTLSYGSNVSPETSLAQQYDRSRDQGPLVRDDYYMYIAYSRFGAKASDVLQLCEHQALPTPNKHHGELLIKILVSFLLQNFFF